MTYRLVISTPAASDQVLDSERDVVLVGRRAGCEVRLPHADVGGVHLRLEREEGALHAVDTGAPGGTRVEGKPLRPGVRRLVRDGETIEVGPFRLRYQARSPAGATPVTHQGTTDMARAMMRQMLSALGKESPLGAPSLTVASGPAAGARFELPSPGRVLILGRSETCDAALLDPELSREHARVRRDWAGATACDLGSKNGTRVGGELLVAGVERRLADGDRIALGDTVLAFDDPAEEYLGRLAEAPDGLTMAGKRRRLEPIIIVAAALVVAAVTGLVVLFSS